jgi:hypothetical protein
MAEKESRPFPLILNLSKINPQKQRPTPPGIEGTEINPVLDF